jgi:hypothetical protein
MNVDYFEGRSVKGYSEYVHAADLVVGETYVAVNFVDDDLRVPELRPLVFIGRNLESGDSSLLYFQDAGSYFNGVRYETFGEDDLAEFHTIAEHSPFVLEFECALDVLLKCSLERRRRN